MICWEKIVRTRNTCPYLNTFKKAFRLTSEKWKHCSKFYDRRKRYYPKFEHKMGIRVSTTKFQRDSMKIKKAVAFPISVYYKYLLKSSWKLLADKQLEFGIGLFYRLFKLRPDLIPKFTEFEQMNDVEQLKSWPTLKGHPKKLSYAFNLAIDCLDDGDDFINKIESLGEKHIRKLKNDDLQVMGKAIMQTVQDLLPKEECTKDVLDAWKCLYEYICKLFRESIEKAIQGTR